MKLAFDIGRKIGHPETLQAILLQETNAGQTELIGGERLDVSKQSFGLMQVQLSAARSVMRRFPDIVDRYFPDRTYRSIVDAEIVTLLLENNQANIDIAAHHLKIYMRLCKGDWDKAVAAYNVGIGNVMKIDDPSRFSYVVKIRQRMTTEVQAFNRKHQLR